MERVIILAKKSYDFTNDNGRVKGCKIMYLTDENNNEEDLQFSLINTRNMKSSVNRNLRR